MKPEIKFQIGKNGVTDGVILSLNNAFKTRKSVRISVLKSSGRDKEGVKKMGDEIVTRLGGKFKHIIIGFTIILRKSSESKKK